MTFDAIIVGGGIAGSQAAMTLARACYTVLLIDAGAPRNRFAAQMHNMLGTDGVSPAEYSNKVDKELAQYPSITRVRASVTGARGQNGAFTVTDDAGAQYEARKLLFACGLVDVLPAIEGLAECWGREVQHCTYCHGYEARGSAIGVLTSLEDANYHLSALQAVSKRLHFFFQGETMPQGMDAALAPFGITYSHSPVVRVTRDASGVTVSMQDGTARYCDTLFVKPKSNLSTGVPVVMGCGTDIAGRIKADGTGRTSVAGVYAAGDAAGNYQLLGAALSSGLIAAGALEAELAGEDITRIANRT